MLPKLNSAHGSDTRNIINRAIEVLNRLGLDVQTLVAEGQLTPAQYAELIKYVNGLINENELDDVKANLGATVNALIQQFNLKPLDDPIYIENLWDPEDTVLGTIDQNSGVVIEHASNRTSNFKRILPNQNYTYLRPSSLNFRVVYFDSDQNHIEGTSWIIGGEPVTMKSPSNTAYQRVTLAISSGHDYRTVPFYIAIGDYVPEGVKDGDAILYDGGFWENIPTPPLKPDSVNKQHLKSLSVERKHLNDGIIDPENTTFIDISYNKFDKSAALLNKAGDSSTGEIIDFNDNFVSAPMDVSPGEILTKEYLTRWLLYRHDDSFIGQNISDTYTIPEETAYVRTNGQMSDIDKAQIVKGSEKLPYEAYGAKIDESLLPGKQSSATKDWINDKNYHIDGKVDGIYKSVELESKGSGTVKPLTGYSVSDYYADYDALMAKYPDYISKTLLGHDASGTFPIYRYDFIPPRPQNHGYFSDVTLPKAVLVSGSHPERMGIWCLFKTMESIAERWKEDEFLGSLHNNLHFIVVPLWSPWNVENTERWNSNLVNVGRNFPELFVTLPVEDSKYGGTEPLSEPESQYLHKILTEEKDVLFHIDFHNFFNTESFLWSDTKSAAMGRIGDQHIYKMTGEWKNRYPQIPQEHSHYVGYTTIKGDPNGHNCAFAESIGIRSVTYEVGEAIYFEEGQPRYSSMAVTLGTEAFTNYLLSIFKYTVNEKNGNK